MKAVADAVITASTTFREDQVRTYEKAIEKEENESARWVMERILDNARLSQQKRRYPLCNDTGTPHVYIEVGEDAALFEGIFNTAFQGVEKGLRDLPARPMAVKGDQTERIAQLKGLYDDPSKMIPGPFIVENVPGDKVQITVIMLGGGPELRARTYRVYHSRSAERVLREAQDWAVQEAARLGCTCGYENDR